MISKVTFFNEVNSIMKSAQEIVANNDNQSLGFFDREIKISLDLELDLFIKNSLEKMTGIKVLSEESADHLPQNGKVWIVDPIDGSLNFHKKIPFYSTSISLWENQKPLLGFIFDYSRNEFFVGEVGVGAFLNNKAIKVNNTPHSEGVLATGIPSSSKIEDSLNLFKNNLKIFKKLRWLGCASLSLCYVACGRFEGYKENDIKIWDVAAGLALVLAAGGNINYHFKNEFTLDVSALNFLDSHEN